MILRSVFPVLHIRRVSSCPHYYNGIPTSLLMRSDCIRLSLHHFSNTFMSPARSAVFGVGVGSFKCDWSRHQHLHRIHSTINGVPAIRFYSDNKQSGKKEPSSSSSPPSWDWDKKKKLIKIVLCGMGVLLIGRILYGIYAYFFGGRSSKVQGDFSKIRLHAFHICQNNRQVMDVLGTPIEIESNERERFEEYRVAYISDPSKSFKNFSLRFKIRGPTQSGTVYLERKKNGEGRWEYTSLTVDAEGKNIQVPITGRDMQKMDRIMDHHES